MKNIKVPGISGLTTDMLKVSHLVMKLILNFWSNKDINYESWHTQKLSNLYIEKEISKTPIIGMEFV